MWGEWNYLYIGLNCALCIWHDMVIYWVSFYPSTRCVVLVSFQYSMCRQT